MPKEKYTHAPEILAHSRAIGEHFDLYRNALLPDRGHRACAGTTTTRAGSSRPTAATRCGPASCAWPTARCTGPKLPGIPGIETFKGHTFHTSRWDYDYTGGDSDGEPHRPRRTSASASSAPARRPCSASRTSARRPSSCTCSSARRRRSTCAPTARPIPSGRRASQPGWQQRRMDNFNTLVSGGFADRGPGQRRLDRHHRQAADRSLRDDGGRRVTPTSSAATMELADFEKMEQIRARVDAIVEGPGDGRGAEAVLPPVLQAAVLPRRVPATPSTGPTSRSSTPRARASSASPRTGVVVDGVEYELDCLIYATGFEVGTELHAPRRLRGHRPRRRRRSPRSGPTACRRCTACTAAASRTASSSATRSRASP